MRSRCSRLRPHGPRYSGRRLAFARDRGRPNRHVGRTGAPAPARSSPGGPPDAERRHADRAHRHAHSGAEQRGHHPRRLIAGQHRRRRDDRRAPVAGAGDIDLLRLADRPDDDRSIQSLPCVAARPGADVLAVGRPLRRAAANVGMPARSVRRPHLDPDQRRLSEGYDRLRRWSFGCPETFEAATQIEARDLGAPRRICHRSGCRPTSSASPITEMTSSRVGQRAAARHRRMAKRPHRASGAARVDRIAKIRARRDGLCIAATNGRGLRLTPPLGLARGPRPARASPLARAAWLCRTRRPSATAGRDRGR